MRKDHSTSATETGMRLGDWTWRNRGRRSEVNLPGESDLSVPRECMLEVGAGIKNND